MQYSAAKKNFNMILHKLKRYNSYQIAVFISSLSLAFGILREFLIVGLLGFTANNDKLQIYLSIFYTIGLTIDAMRLACLNLFSVLSLPRLILSASIIGLPFAIAIGLIMNYSTGGLNIKNLSITIFGSYLNLIAALLITYKQRDNTFLPAQIINVMPNFILIPGIIVCYWFAKTNVVSAIVALTSLIPVVQCVLLLLLPTNSINTTPTSSISIFASVITFARHFSAMIGEQLFQIITRAAFFNYGAGYLSIFAMTIRIYSALRFILIDSYIGATLSNGKKELQRDDYYLLKMINSTLLGVILAFLALFISINTSHHLIQSAIQIVGILSFGFYFSTLMRVVYFRINRHENNSFIIWRFAIYELVFAFFAFILTKQLNYPLLVLLWIGYVAKPFTQLLFLRKKFYGLSLSEEVI
jgi:hypothetical protein